MKVKIFAPRKKMFQFSFDIPSQIEKDINHWLENNPKIKITNIKQSSCGGSFDVEKHFISAWYEED